MYTETFPAVKLGGLALTHPIVQCMIVTAYLFLNVNIYMMCTSMIDYECRPMWVSRVSPPSPKINKPALRLHIHAITKAPPDPIRIHSLYTGDGQLYI